MRGQSMALAQPDALNAAGSSSDPPCRMAGPLFTSLRRPHQPLPSELDAPEEHYLWDPWSPWRQTKREPVPERGGAPTVAADLRFWRRKCGGIAPRR